MTILASLCSSGGIGVMVHCWALAAMYTLLTGSLSDVCRSLLRVLVLDAGGGFPGRLIRQEVAVVPAEVKLKPQQPLDPLTPSIGVSPGLVKGVLSLEPASSGSLMSLAAGVEIWCWVKRTSMSVSGSRFLFG